MNHNSPPGMRIQIMKGTMVTVNWLNTEFNHDFPWSASPPEAVHHKAADFTLATIFSNGSFREVTMVLTLAMRVQS